MAQTPDGRQFLRYLTSCALPADHGTFVVVEGTRYEFRGSMALAPEWLSRPLNESEQRWLSAGILARTNVFGKHVRISMRHPGSGFASLEADADEARSHDLHEGDFFGNLFADPPVACVAPGRLTAAEKADPILTIRVGTLPDGVSRTADGDPVSRCGFAIVGPAPRIPPAAYEYHGRRYAEYISVYLKRGLSSVEPDPAVSRP